MPTWPRSPHCWTPTGRPGDRGRAFVRRRDRARTRDGTARSRCGDWCCSTPPSGWTVGGCARSPTRCSPRPTTPTATRPAPRRCPAPGARSTRPNSSGTSTSTSSTCPMDASAGGSASRRCMSYWSELARPFALPRDGTPTTLIRATRTDPPYVSEELISALDAQLGSDFTLLDFDCDHMVAQAKPAETAATDPRATRADMRRDHRRAGRERPCPCRVDTGGQGGHLR